MLEQFHFLRPAWLLALLPLAVLVWLIWKRKMGSRGWEAFCDPALLPYILAGGGGRGRRLPLLLLAAGGLLAILALAGPAWDKLPQPVFSSQSSLVVALDLSRSMAADDVSPSRYGRARFKIRDLLAQRAEGRTALLVYAGDAFTVTPLTDDADTIVSQLQALSPDIMPAPGNRTDIALERARELLQQAGAGHGHVLVITDAVEVERAFETAEDLYESGYRVSVMGVGTEHGVPVPLGDGGFLKDEQGEIVIPTLEEAPLRRLAEAGGGLYTRLRKDDTDVARLARQFSGSRGDATRSSRVQADVWRERGPWLLLLLLPLAALAFRRGYLVVLLCLLLPLPEPARALDWDGLWQRDDQRARQALERGEPERAAELFSDPAWRGAARYRAGDYQGAVEDLRGLEGADNLYNLGNALARLGRYQAAIEAYEKALEQNPQHEDARYNKQLVEEALKQQQQQQQAGGQQQQQEDKQQQQQQPSPEQDGAQQERSPEQRQQQQQQQQQGQESPERQQRERDQETAARDKQQQQRGERQRSPEQQPEPGRQRRADVPAADDRPQPDEQQQAVEQWLRRIPDDPGELLRRKFLYQYQQRQQERNQ